MYRGEIGALQLAHFPRSASHERIGMFWYHLIGELHFGQCDGGETIDSPLGARQITTFRNEAMQAPSQKLKNAKIGARSFIMLAS
jgi:hypothetical protein